MTHFQELLSEFLKIKNTTIYTLAKLSGVERSHIQKMKSGSRIPANEETVINLSQALMLTPSENAEFIRAYRIAKMGEHNYYRRQFVKEIVESFYDVRSSSAIITESATQSSLHMKQNQEIITGKINIQKIIKTMLEIEAAKENACIKLITQPMFTYLYDCIATMDLNRNNTTVENIISFDKTTDEKSVLYNLNLFKCLVPLLFACNNFHSYYIYEYVNAVFNESSVLPYKIITSDYVLQISYDIDQAMLSANPQMIDIVQQAFEKKKLLAKPIYRTIKPDPDSYYAVTPNFMEFDSPQTYGLLYQPSMPPFCDLETMHECINKDILTPEMLSGWAKHFTSMNNYKGVLNMAFTLEGMKLFLETGQIMEIPNFMLASRPGKCQRLQMMRRFIDAVKSGRVRASVVKTPLFNLPLPVILIAYSKQNIVLHYLDQQNGIYFIRLEEISLINAFYDFITWNMDGDFVYPEEESLALIEKTYEKYAKLYLH